MHDGKLLNLSAFKSISRDEISSFEDEDGVDRLVIAFTPLTPSLENIQNNVDGTTRLIYNTDEEDDFEADFEVIEAALKEM